MVRNLRVQLDEDEFNRFKSILGQVGADTNDEALVELMDFYDEYSVLVNEIESVSHEYGLSPEEMVENYADGESTTVND